MFGTDYLKQLSTKKTILPEQQAEQETDAAVDLTDSFIILGQEPFEDDYVVISAEDGQREHQIYALSVDSELLAKNEAYNLSVPISENRDTAPASKMRLGEQGITVHPLGTDAAREKGIFLYALVNETNRSEPITIVARGTQFDASIIADVDPTAPGHTTLQEMLPDVLSQLDTLCELSPDRKVRVTGHSLGGSLAQMLTSSLLEVKRRALEDPSSTYVSLGKITGVDTVIFQSAGMSEQLIQAAEKNVVCINYLDPTFDINFIAHVKEGDFVSRTGQYLFSDIDPSVVNVTLILRDLDKPCMTLGDCLSVGMTAATTCSPAWIALESIKTLGVRYVENRVEAHTDFFYHDNEGISRTDTTVHGIYRNANVEDREKIKHVFKSNILANIPFAKGIQEVLFKRTNELSTSDFLGLAAATRSVVVGSLALLKVLSSLGKPQEVVISMATEAPKINEAAGTWSKHAQHAKNGFFKLFGFMSHNDATKDECLHTKNTTRPS